MTNPKANTTFLNGQLNPVLVMGDLDITDLANLYEKTNRYVCKEDREGGYLSEEYLEDLKLDLEDDGEPCAVTFEVNRVITWVIKEGGWDY